MVEPFVGGPSHDGHRDGRGALSVRWGSLVQHAIWPRRHYYGTRSVMDQTADRSRGARLLGVGPGEGTEDGAGCRAGEDSARDAKGGNGRAGRDSFWTVLRQCGFDTTLCHVGGSLL